MPTTLMGRSMAIILIPLILLQLVATWVFYNRHWEVVTERLTTSLRGEIATVIYMAERTETQSEREEVFGMARWTMGLLIEWKEGEMPIKPLRRFAFLDSRLSEAMERLDRPFSLDTRSTPGEAEVLVKMDPGYLQILVSRNRLFSSTTYIFILWMVGASAILFGVAGIFLRNQVRPIRRLAAAADGFGKGRTNDRFKPEGALEVRQASRAFIDMQHRINRQITQRTRMLSGVSHDLRTPLTRMKLQLAMLEQSEDTDNLASDIHEMEAMIEGYLAFARGEGTEESVEIKIKRQVDEVIQDAIRSGQKITRASMASTRLFVKKQAFKRCLTNLVSNAHRYGGTETVISGGPTDQGWYLIHVDDNGPGIPESLRDAAFQPFYRFDDSRNISTGGVGLGLTIARDIALSHGGRLELSDSPAGGLRATISLPI
jgi:two-component system osmolarity sensor histidine kinase EnvZ